MSTYLAVTPAYNEERFIGNLIRCITEQTRQPVRWLIIDDGSTDRTSTMIDQAAADYPWITPVHLLKRDKRLPGGESVVMNQLKAHGWEGVDAIFRVDADVTFERNYVERLLDEFARDPNLGIASGALYEPVNGEWLPNHEPSFQATGNCRIYSRRCFEAIGGIKSGLGWDTIDVTTALMMGFATRRLADVPIHHHRPMQTANGRWQGRLNVGEAAYNAGYSPLFMAARAARHTFDRPVIAGGLLMMFAYLRCWVRGQPMLAEPELVRFVRRQQLRRLVGAESVWR